MSFALQSEAILAARRNLTVCVVWRSTSDGRHARHGRGAEFAAVGTVNSLEALERARLGRCRVILADCKLPGMDGLALLENVLYQDPAMHVILMSTAHLVDSRLRQSSMAPTIVCANLSTIHA